MVRQFYEEVTRQIAEGDLVVSRVTMRGTHNGEWLGIAPTGQAIAITAVNIDRVLGGRIIEFPLDGIAGFLLHVYL